MTREEMLEKIRELEVEIAELDEKNKKLWADIMRGEKA